MFFLCVGSNKLVLRLLSTIEKQHWVKVPPSRLAYFSFFLLLLVAGKSPQR